MTLQRADRSVARLLKALRKSGMMEDTLVILAADDGHHPTSKHHSSKNHPVPFMVMGTGIKKGEIKEDMRNNMIAPLVRKTLTGLPAIGFDLNYPNFDFLFEQRK